MNYQSEQGLERGQLSAQRMSYQTQRKSKLTTQPSMNSVDMGAKTKSMAVKNMNFAKNRMLRVKGDRGGGTSHGNRV